MDPLLPVVTAPAVPLNTEIPNLTDIVSGIFSWGAGWALKRFAEGKSWEKAARRALPIVAVAVGAGAQVAYAAFVSGMDLKTAALRGAIAGGAAVWAQSVNKATVNGKVGGG